MAAAVTGRGNSVDRPSTVEVHLTELIWDGKAPGYVENPDNWIFS